MEAGRELSLEDEKQIPKHGGSDRSGKLGSWSLGKNLRKRNISNENIGER